MLREEIILIIADTLGVSEHEVRPETVLRSLTTDSLELIFLIQELEIKGGIIISDEEVQNIYTVNDILTRMVPN